MRSEFPDQMRSVSIDTSVPLACAATYRESLRARHNAPMKHTFLFEPAVWSGTGTLWRADGEPLEAHARTEIAHRPDCWLLSGKLRVLGSPPTEFMQAYLIEPPKRAR